ncbi:MAG TPA: formylglycine-generating enzyme family protein, partial [Pirellulaceae bacterium]|nr:formylglycine-generating enzyme family protein [Pirellulaceae bacterium]
PIPRMSPDTCLQVGDIELPRHEVTIQYPLLVGKYPVTFEEWDSYVTKASSVGFLGIGSRKPHNPSGGRWGSGRQPVTNVSWNDAKAYVGWLSKKTGQRYRLLSEAEWEYACRAGTDTLYCFGDSITESQAQFSGDDWGSAKQSAEVGKFPANNFGLHDMHGNVWEWCQDVWHEQYYGAPIDGSAWNEGGDKSKRVTRGGSWCDVSKVVRSALRIGTDTDLRMYAGGFRVARCC